MCWGADLISLERASVLFLLLSYSMVIWPFSWIISSLMDRKWGDEVQAEEGKGLKGAGKWIGRLERILILTFILVGQLQAVGYLIAAKAIFRFNQLQEDRDRKRTEYVMIGTFLSFTSTIVLGVLLRESLSDPIFGFFVL